MFGASGYIQIYPRQRFLKKCSTTFGQYQDFRMFSSLYRAKIKIPRKSCKGTQTLATIYNLMIYARSESVNQNIYFTVNRGSQRQPNLRPIARWQYLFIAQSAHWVQGSGTPSGKIAGQSRKQHGCTECRCAAGKNQICLLQYERLVNS